MDSPSLQEQFAALLEDGVESAQRTDSPHISDWVKPTTLATATALVPSMEWQDRYEPSSMEMDPLGANFDSMEMYTKDLSGRENVDWQSQPGGTTFPIRGRDCPSNHEIVFPAALQYSPLECDPATQLPTRPFADLRRRHNMDGLDLEEDGHETPPQLDDDEDSDSYQSTNPPRYIEARAKLVFPDCDYPITKPVSIIGRGPGLPRVLASRNLEDSAEAEELEEYYITAGAKRRRKDSGEFAFRGGLGGPQSPVSPDDDPVLERINIWPPLNEDGTVPNTISREHAKISWDTRENGWVVEVLGRNGLYLQGLFYKIGDIVHLENGDNIIISQVDIFFFTAEDEEEDYPVFSDDSNSDDDRDDDSQDEDGSAIDVDESEGQYITGRRRRPVATIEMDDEDEGEDEDDVDEMEEEEEEEESKAKPKLRLNLKPQRRKSVSKSTRKSTMTVKAQLLSRQTNGRRIGTHKIHGPRETKAKRRATKDTTPEEQSPEDQDERLAAEQDQRKRGPGRPPADGVMSKKERRDRERAKRLGLEYGKDELPVRPHTKPRKDKDTLEDASEETKKHKKSRRKASEVEEPDGEPKEEDAGSQNEHSVPRKEPTPRPATPEPRREEFNQEQLQKPELTYHVMLVEILSKSDRSMSLPEIYKAFKKRWPYFYFLGSHGWESSIRHNLQSSPCILKDGKQGKGHNWKFHPELMKEEPKQNRQKTSQGRPPAYPPMPQGTMQQSLPQGHGYQSHMPTSYPQGPRQQQVSSQPFQTAHQTQSMPNSQPQHAYPQGHQPQPGPPYHVPFPVGQMQPTANSTQQHQTQAAAPNGVAPTSHTYGTQPSSQFLPGPQNQAPRQTYPVQGGAHFANGTTQHHLTGQPRPSASAMGVGVAQRAAVPGPSSSNTHAGTKSARDNKRTVFEHFRSSLVKNVKDNETQLRYNRLVNQAINWLMQNPEATTFNSTDGDLNKVVPQMMSLWNGHHLNPASANFSGHGSPAMRQSPSTSAGPTASPVHRAGIFPPVARYPQPAPGTQAEQPRPMSTPSTSVNGTPQPPPSAASPGPVSGGPIRSTQTPQNAPNAQSTSAGPSTPAAKSAPGAAGATEAPELTSTLQSADSTDVSAASVPNQDAAPEDGQ